MTGPEMHHGVRDDVLFLLLLQGEKKQFGEAGQPTKVALEIYETLTSLQQQRTEDPFGWVVPVV